MAVNFCFSKQILIIHYIPTICYLRRRRKTSGFETETGLGVTGRWISFTGNLCAQCCLRWSLHLFHFVWKAVFSLKPCFGMEAPSLISLRFQTLPVPLHLVTPFPRCRWLAHPLFYHPAFLILAEDEWLWLKKLNNGQTEVQRRVNLRSFSCFLDQVWGSLPSTHICQNSFNHGCFFFRNVKLGSFVFQSFLFSRKQCHVWTLRWTHVKSGGGTLALPRVPV